MSKPRDVSTVRTFVAIELPNSLKTAVEDLRSAFPDDAPVRWSPSGLLHITVRFLGSVDALTIPDVEAAVRAAAFDFEPFQLALSGLGAFPNERSPRVLWVGPQKDEGYARLEALFQALERELAERGFPREARSFSPHVTLARTRDTASPPQRRALGEALQRAKATRRIVGGWLVREIVVMRSDLGRSGPQYTPLLTVSLGAGTLA